MALDSKAQAQLWEIFQAEADEHCRVLTHAFLALEKRPEPIEQEQLVADAFRAAHNFKGAARIVGLETTAALAHTLEAVLEAVQHDRLALAAPLFDVLHRAVDALNRSHDGEQDPAELRGSSQDLLAELEQLAASPIPADLEGTPPDGAPSAMEAVTAPPALSQLRPSGSSETIRLPAERLDSMLELLGEFVTPRMEAGACLSELAVVQREIDVARQEWTKVRPLLRQVERDQQIAALRPLLRRLETADARMSTIGPTLKAARARLSGATNQLATLTESVQADAKRFRMLPFGTLTDSFERLVRDLGSGLGKSARLLVLGGDTELDKRVLEQMKDPLMHLLRNALDHGLETPEERQLRGKPAVGMVRIAASQRGATIAIEVEDDGVGLDPTAIRHAAAARQPALEAGYAAMTDRQALRLVFLPGVSTRDTADEISGRGVGLDVVARNVELLDGQIDLESTPGQGTRFVITLPLTLTTTRGVVVEAGGATYALPTTALERVLPGAKLGMVGGRTVLEQDDRVVPAANLACLMGHGSPPPTGSRGVLALLAVGSERVAVEVDRVIGEQEIMVKPLGFPLLRVAGIAGATILASGQVVPVLNLADLVRMAAGNPGSALAEHHAPVAEQTRRLRVLVAEDSLTTRTMERYILEAAGFDVELAGDGAEAFNLLQEHDCDALVSDINMPRLDGIGLTLKLRQNPKFHDLPIILVTALESAADRERGLEAGADAYVIKSAFDQDHLLRTIRELV